VARYTTIEALWMAAFTRSQVACGLLMSTTFELYLRAVLAIASASAW